MAIVGVALLIIAGFIFLDFFVGLLGDILGIGVKLGLIAVLLIIGVVILSRSGIIG